MLTIKLTCKVCGGKAKPNAKKLATIAGCSAVIAACGVIACTPTGWMGLIPALMAGSPKAKQILHMKYHAWRASEEAGCYLQCGDCGRDIPWEEVFN